MTTTHRSPGTRELTDSVGQPTMTDSENAEPSQGRLVAIDVTRGLAILGMIAIHSLNEYDDNGVPTLSYTIFAGRASAAFAVLAGISISLIVGRRQLHRGAIARGKVASLLARAAIIGIIGLALGYTDPTMAVVILPSYALIFLLAIPLTFLSTRALACLTPLLVVLTPIASQLLRPLVPDGRDEQLSFAYGFHHPAQFLSDVSLTGEFPAIVWLSYVCVGLLVGRLPLRSLSVAGWMLLIGATLMTAARMVSLAWFDLGNGREHATNGLAADYSSDLVTFGGDGTVPTNSWWWLTFDGPHTGTPFDLAATIGSTLVALGVVLAAEHLLTGRAHTVLRRILTPLSALGTMALTAYTAHLMFINSGFDVYGPVSGYVRQLVFLFAFATIWQATAGRGPLEGLIRAVTRRMDRWARRTCAAAPDPTTNAGATAH